MRRLVLLLISGVALVSAEPVKTHQEWRREANVAVAKKDYVAAREAYAAALALRPDSPRYLHNYAAMCTLTGRNNDALQTLRRLVALGVTTGVEKDEDFAALREMPPYMEIVKKFAANRAPLGKAAVEFELPEEKGIIEGIAYRERTGDFFLGDVHRRCVWRELRTAA